MPCLKGFKEKFGVDLLKEEYVKRCLYDVAINYGYQDIVIPVIEHASSFSEEVVGKSPWPEWNEKGCFFFEIDEFEDNYEYSKKERVLLIPEGTVSVTRWLGDQINEDSIDFPIKLFYSLKCYRNEILNTLSKTKWREFEQFGMEILGTSNIQADVEIIYMIVQLLSSLGIDKKAIRIRLSDITIFNKMIKESAISLTDQIRLKELLDFLAEAKAGKHSETLFETKEKIFKIIRNYKMSNRLYEMWNALVESGFNQIYKIKKYFDSTYHSYFEQLEEIRNEFAKTGVDVFIDLCVIRSHEYYTGISFEVDVLADGKLFFEIAGGGRYNRLVQHFINEDKGVGSVPCTGFAFGVERLVNMLDDLGIYEEKKTIISKFAFGTFESSLIYPEDNSVSAYFKSVKSGKMIYIGDNNLKTKGMEK